MRIRFTLNGQNISEETPADTRLVDLLHESQQMHHTKAGCYSGICGSCSILFNGEIALSCLVPVFAARNADIITLEGFAKTNAYRDIKSAFDRSGYTPCPTCRQSKFLSVHGLLESHVVPDRAEIESTAQYLQCRCGNQSALLDAISHIIVSRRSQSDVR